MKEALIQQIDNYSPGQAGWHKDLAEGVSSEVCSCCGGDLYFANDIVDKNHRKVPIPGCVKINRLYYLRQAPQSSDRHGLV